MILRNTYEKELLKIDHSWHRSFSGRLPHEETLSKMIIGIAQVLAQAPREAAPLVSHGRAYEQHGSSAEPPAGVLGAAAAQPLPLASRQAIVPAADRTRRRFAEPAPRPPDLSPIDLACEVLAVTFGDGSVICDPLPEIGRRDSRGAPCLRRFAVCCKWHVLVASSCRAVASGCGSSARTG